MSRSFKKRAFSFMTGCKSQKEDKRSYNRSMRRTNHVELAKKTEDAVFAIVPEVMDVWGMSGDGPKRYRPFRPGDDYRLWYRWTKAK